MRKHAFAEVFDYLERFVTRSEPSDPVDRECPHLVVRWDIGEEIESTLRVHQSIRIDLIVLLAATRERVVSHRESLLVKDGVEEPSDGLSLPGDEPIRRRSWLRFDRSRQAVEKGSHPWSECTLELGKRVPQVILERRTRQALHDRSAEIQSRQFTEREAGVVQPFEGTGAELPRF